MLVMLIGPEEVAIRLGLAVLLGGLVGFERESHGRPAGFRTHILVCLGSTLVMLVSISGFSDFVSGPGNIRVDPGRLAAQVVSGIGFLGAGTILREGVSIRGLTTAASLWVVAAIGLGIGSGFYLGAVVTTGLVVLTLAFLNRIETMFSTGGRHLLTVEIIDKPGELGQIASVLGEHGVNIRTVEIEQTGDLRASIELGVMLTAKSNQLELAEAVRALDGVVHVAFRS